MTEDKASTAGMRLAKQQARVAMLRHLGGLRGTPGVRRVHKYPVFAEAAQAAQHLCGVAAIARSDAVLCSTAQALQPWRRAWLQAGRTLYCFPTRSAAARGFGRLVGAELAPEVLEEASRGRGAWTHGEAVELDMLPQLDGMVVGSIAVAANGARLGRGGGWSDCLYAVLRERGVLAADTWVATLLSKQQWVEALAWPQQAHDVYVDYSATPQRVWTAPPTFAQPDLLALDAWPPSQRALLASWLDRWEGMS